MRIERRIEVFRVLPRWFGHYQVAFYSNGLGHGEISLNERALADFGLIPGGQDPRKKMRLTINLLKAEGESAMDGGEVHHFSYLDSQHITKFSRREAAVVPDYQPDSYRLALNILQGAELPYIGFVRLQISKKHFDLCSSFTSERWFNVSLKVL